MLCWSASNEYPQHMFSWRNEKNINNFWTEQSISSTGKQIPVSSLGTILATALVLNLQPLACHFTLLWNGSVVVVAAFYKQDDHNSAILFTGAKRFTYLILIFTFCVCVHACMSACMRVCVCVCVCLCVCVCVCVCKENKPSPLVNMFLSQIMTAWTILVEGLHGNISAKLSPR